MDQQLERELKNKYLEFRSTSAKIGLEEALVQYKSSNQQDWRFETLCELYYIQTTVQKETVDRANKSIRAVARLLNNEAFLKEHGILVPEVIEFYDDIEYEQTNVTCWKHLLEGFVHLSTRSDIVRGLVKNDELIYAPLIDDLLQCVHKLDSKYSIQLSEMIFKVIEEYPSYAFTLRFKLTEMQILPDLVTRLTAGYCRDSVEFLNGIFYAKPTWFLAQSVNSGQYFIKIKHRIIADIEASMASSDNIDHVTMCLSIRALAGIIGYFGIKLNEAEVVLCIKILNKTTSERLVKLILSLILLSADQFLKKQNEVSRSLDQLLLSEISEMPLLIMVYFQTDAISQVEDLIRSVLSMQIPIPKLGLFEMQKLFRSLKPASI